MGYSPQKPKIWLSEKQVDAILRVARKRRERDFQIFRLCRFDYGSVKLSVEGDCGVFARWTCGPMEFGYSGRGVRRHSIRFPERYSTIYADTLMAMKVMVIHRLTGFSRSRNGL